MNLTRRRAVFIGCYPREIRVRYSSRALFQTCFVNLLQGYDLRLKGFDSKRSTAITVKSISRREECNESRKDRIYFARELRTRVLKKLYPSKFLLFKFPSLTIVSIYRESWYRLIKTREDKRPRDAEERLKEVKTQKANSRGLRFKKSSNNFDPERSCLITRRLIRNDLISISLRQAARRHIRARWLGGRYPTLWKNFFNLLKAWRRKRRRRISFPFSRPRYFNPR